MGGIKVEFNEIKELIELIDKSELRSFELNVNGVALRMSKNNENLKAETATVSSPHTVMEASSVIEKVHAEAEEITEKSSVKTEEIIGNIVKAPIVGTFYSSPAPDKADFVKVGDSVKKGDVLCIIEAMKVMNEVVSDFDGVIKAVMAENETLVEYGQPLFTIG